MLSKIYSIELTGLSGHLVEIEVDTRPSIPGVTIVGLPDAAVQEAKERVISAARNSDYLLPRGRIIVNLAPADLKKNGPRYDLPIALGLIVFSGLISGDMFKDTIFFGELALNGDVRPLTGVLASVEYAKQQGFKKVMLPKANAPEASLIPGIEIIPVGSLKEAVLYLSGGLCSLPVHAPQAEIMPGKYADMSVIRGQILAKRALEIAAAGSHNILMNGSPGSGKTLMAKAFQGILPKMSHEEMLEVTKIYSVAGKLPDGCRLVNRRPFRPVHHTASAISIVGGGNNPAPGEITLAHRGVLFMDEIAEFPQTVLEVLRQPMEDQQITISRARGSLTYPAQFILIAAMNPCPCGYLNAEGGKKRCSCPAWKVLQYRKKLSGPLLDRFDIKLNIQPVPHEKLVLKAGGESSAEVRARVEKAADIQEKRFKNTGIRKNAEMDNVMIQKYCQLDTYGQKLMEQAVNRFDLSARAYFRTIKLARTIADLCGAEKISPEHISEALQYRNKAGD